MNEVDINDPWFLEWEQGLVGEKLPTRSKHYDEYMYGENVTRFAYERGPTATQPTSTDFGGPMFSLKRDSVSVHHEDIASHESMEVNFRGIREDELKDAVW